MRAKHVMGTLLFMTSYHNIKMPIAGIVWFLGRTKYLIGRTSEWVADPLGPGQTSAQQLIASKYPNQSL